jgi:hypothetical protein
MKQDQWTQQLREKLAEHKVAPPEGLWEDIEAALQQQSRQSRFVALRRWAVAASLAALMAGGGYWWWSQKDVPFSAQADHVAPKQPAQLAQSQPSPQEERIKIEAVEPVTRLSCPKQRDTQPIAQIEPPLPPPAAEEKEEVVKEGVTPPEPKSERRIVTEEPYRPMKESVVRKAGKSPTLSLYAMNGMGAQNSSNGVQMADALAKQYWETYEQSNYAAARAYDPIYLTGYEEREHHHQPFICGLSLSYPLTERLSLTTGVVYTKLNSDFTQIMRSQQIQQEQTLHYVGVPLSLSYLLWSYKGFRTYLSAGAKADWNVSTHLVTEGVTQELPKDRMQWSLNGSLGLQYDVVPQLGLYAEPGVSWYPDNGSNLRNYFKDKPLNFNVQVGLRLTFMKKKL